MGKRPKIGLLFSLSQGWIGGSYYFLNIVAALNVLPDADKPEIIIYSNNRASFELTEKETHYPYLQYKNSVFKYNIAERVINKISRIISKRDIIKKGLPTSDMQLLFGYYEQLILHKCDKKIYWIPDFQEYYYPELIGYKETTRRQITHKLLIAKKADFIFSSQDALYDFNKIYPDNHCRSAVVKFAVTHPDFSDIAIEDLEKKFNFSGTYFFTPNQFWPHKNHITVLKALKEAKRVSPHILLLLSGNAKPEQAHTKMIFDYIKENGLTQNVLFLGFIDRKEQLCIMKHALAVVQPSLFEGWSTVVEDAKAMSKFLILSDLRVHREQTINYACDLFEPENVNQLTACLIRSFKSPPAAEYNCNYKSNISTFANDFLSFVNTVINN